MKTILTFISLTTFVVTFAQMPGWNNVKVIQLQENSGVNLINYQMELTINTANYVSTGEMLPTGNDIRFSSACTGGTNYSYWIESGMNTANTKIWVKIDTLLANSSKNIYLHFGNNSATSLSAIAGTFNGPHSSTDSVASGGNGGVGNSQRGFRFSPNETLLVTAFGKREPNGTTRFITLFDVASQAILAQTQVSGPAAQYSYSNLANPIWLQQGTQYIIQLYQGAGDGYYYGASSQIGQHLTYYDMRYCNSCTENSFPTAVLSNYHYGYPDLWYFTKNTAAVNPSYSLGNIEITISPAGATTFCQGASVDLNTNSGTGLTYQWQNNGTSISGANAASYSATTSGSFNVLSIIDGCSVTSNAISVTVNPLPTVDAGNPQTVCAGNFVSLSGSGADNYVWDNNVLDGVPFTASATMTYTVTGTDGNNCSNSDQVTVTVNALPVINAGSDQVICEGDPVTLSASGADSYSWDNGVTNGSLFTPTHLGDLTYTVSGTDANNCSNTDQVVVTVNEHSSATQTATGLDSFTWPVNGQTYTQSGTYSAVIPNAAGCDSTITLNLTLDFTGIGEMGAHLLAVYPNPTTSFLTIEGDWIQNKDYLLIDIQGRAVLNGTFKLNKETIDLTTLARGQYLLRVEGKELKVVKE